MLGIILETVNFLIKKCDRNVTIKSAKFVSNEIWRLRL